MCTGYVHHILLLAIFALCPVARQLPGEESTRMTFSDYFFDKIGLQLIHTPPESRALLDKAARGVLTPSEVPGADVAIRMAEAWVRNILRKEYQPPLGAVFLPFRKESGICDVVRSVYRAGGLEIEVAQTFSMFSVTVKSVGAKPSEDGVARAERVARLLLNTKTPIGLQILGTEENFTYGKQRAPYGPFESDWSELLRWWCTSDSVGFITVKTTKAPERAVVGPGEDTNSVWFDFYKPN
jgi:hypothetical protein